MFARLVNYFNGRHTFFVFVCMAIGVTTAWFGKLDANLVALLLGLQTLILSHSIKDDHYQNGDKA